MFMLGPIGFTAPWLLLGLIALPILIQSYTIFAIAYGAAYALRVPHHIAAPCAMIGTSNFFELAVAVAISLFWLGVQEQWGTFYVWLASGITAYGAIYFGFHDIIVHRRIETGYVPRSSYMKRIVQAHRLHQHGLQPRRKLLLIGPPGAGKGTQAAWLRDPEHPAVALGLAGAAQAHGVRTLVVDLDRQLRQRPRGGSEDDRCVHHQGVQRESVDLHR